MLISTIHLKAETNLSGTQNSSITTAKISFIAAVGFLLLVTLLHFIKSDLDPSWRMISEYAIGNNGWIMVVAFLMWAASYTSLFFSIRSQITTLGGKLGLGLLLVSALSLVIAAIFITDPVTAGKDETATSGMLHNLGGTLGMAMPFAFVFTSRSLYKNPNWITARRPILWSAMLAVTGFLISIISLGVFFSNLNGVAGPNVPVGYPLRFEAFTYCIWLIVVSKQAINVQGKKLN